MGKQNRLRGVAPVRAALSAALLLAAWFPAAGSSADGDGALVEQLRRELAEREAQVVDLKERLARLQSQRASEPADAGGDDELDRALESSLVRQGGSVLRAGTREIEPEISYFYDEPSRSGRRDGFGLALTGRIGLPGSMQAELRLPYVVSDHWSGVGESAGWGDVRLSLLKEFIAATPDGRPSLLAFAQWRAPTGDEDRLPPTGHGQHAIQIGVTTVARQDPVVLFGSLFYTFNLDSTRLRDRTRYEAGDVLGGRLGAYLAATPDTSLYAGLAFDANAADRLDGMRIKRSSTMSGVLELGTTTILGRGRFLNVTGGIGFTREAPEFSLAVSLPMRF